MNLIIHQQREGWAYESISFASWSQKDDMFFCPTAKMTCIQLFIMRIHLPSSSHCCCPLGTVFFAYLHISTYTRCLRTKFKLTLLASLANALITEETELLNKYINSFICEFPICILLSQFP